MELLKHVFLQLLRDYDFDAPHKAVSYRDFVPSIPIGFETLGLDAAIKIS